MSSIKHWDSLQSLTSHQIYVESNLRRMISHPLGITHLWVLVEGEADMYLYERMFDTYTVKVVRAGRYNKRGDVIGGVHAVKEVVEHLLALGISQLIIGIIDRDWRMFYKNAQKELPANIFLTDHRDLEMTLLSVKQVRNLMVAEIISNMSTDSVRALGGRGFFPPLWIKCCDISRYIGSLRIVAAYYQLPRFDFGETLYWNQTLKCVVPQWEQNIFNKAFELSSPVCKIKFLFYCWMTKVRFGLNRLSVFDVCRGHDFLHILSVMLIDTSHFSEKWMTYFMAKEIPEAEIRELTMYKSIDNWMKKNGVNRLAF